MEYRNPRLPEGINAGRRHPLADFLLLGGGLLLLVSVAAILLALGAQRLAPLVPFEAELALTGGAASDEGSPMPAAVREYLEGLVQELAAHPPLPDGMRIRLHFVDDDEVNAYAALGGRLVLHRGLLQRLPHENALVMLLGHEITHLRRRHPLQALGRGTVLVLAAASLAGATGIDLVGRAIGDLGGTTLLHFSREQERQADAGGLAMLQHHYGHVAGASDLFRVLWEEGPELPVLLGTHPPGGQRIDELERLAREHGWPTTGPLSPLPPRFARWLREVRPAKD